MVKTLTEAQREKDQTNTELQNQVIKLTEKYEYSN